MNNNRGIKTLHKDYKRVYKIKLKQKKVLEQQEELDEKIKELEKEVKRLQVLTFFKTVPIIISGTILKAIAKNVDELTKLNNQDKQNFTITTPKEVKQKNNKSESKIEIIQTSDIINKKIQQEKTKKEPTKIIEKQEITNIVEERIENLKNKKILENYQEKLKEERTELKEIASNIPKNKAGDIYYQQAQEIYEKLNLVLYKLEKLEQKIKLDRNYDDAYIEYLVEKYTKEFEKGIILKEVKDSEFYILISKKLDELEEEKLKIKDITDELIREKKEEQEKNKPTEEISENEDKQTETKKEEPSLEEIEESKDDFNYQEEVKEYNDFQEKQSKILKEEQEKYEKAKSDYDKIKVQVEALRRECQELKRLITKRSLIKPTIRNAKIVSTAILTSTYFMKQVIKNKPFKKVRKIIKQKEYQRRVEKNIKDISNVSSLINQTFSQVDSLINLIKQKYSEYHLIEYQSLLEELEMIKKILEERQYEIEKIENYQKEQQRERGKVYQKK